MKRLTLILLASYLPLRAGEDLPDPDTTGLPQRTVAEQMPPRPIPEWRQMHLRAGHLPGSLTMAEEFLKAGARRILHPRRRERRGKTAGCRLRWEVAP